MKAKELGSTSKLKTALFYLLMVGGCAAVFWWILTLGKDLVPSGGLLPDGPPGVEEKVNHLLHILLALAVVVVTARIVGSIFTLINQPPVIGEVLGGILLGPSLLGRLAPDLYLFLLPPSSKPFLEIIAQLGVIFYMFVVGLELDLKVLRKSGHATLAISHSSIVIPFLLGAGLALHIYKDMAGPHVSFVGFALFLGVSMSITAFPVLARILTDRNLQRTRMGTIALTCAAVDDVSAWCLLAVVVSLVQARLGGAVLTIVLTVAYIAAMFLIGGPVIRRFVPWIERFDRLTEGGIAAFFVALLFSSLATEAIGIHAIFGAFLLGAITPHDSRVAKELTNRIQDLVGIMFLPAFFAFTGMRTEIGLLSTRADWELCGIIILLATLGKFGGTFVAAKFSGMDYRDSASLGILMNTRGLVELIVLNIGLDLKVIDSRLFSMLVVMALVTTFLTSPVLQLIRSSREWIR